MRFVVSILFFLICTLAQGQTTGIEFHSTDSLLEKAFINARQMALYYKGNPADPVGHWYEAALPSRNAFCARDVSHQCIAAEILGMDKENKNMFFRFVSNISEGKDWCTFWEINNQGNPAPADYRNDTAFWYNLNANFDLIYASWRLYLWTGDSSYISGNAYINFQEKSLSEFIEKWKLNADSLLTRQPYPNAPVPFNIQDDFHRCRGLPSYNEGVADMKMGVDLVAALYQGFESASAIAAHSGNIKAAEGYAQKAEGYRQHLESDWWDDSSSLFHSHITNKGKFGKGEGEIFLLWFNFLKDSSRIRNNIQQLLSSDLNVETASYLPRLLYKYGYAQKGYDYILHLSDPATKRREYPEVSFGVIDGIVQGLMGIEADARYNFISTIYRATGDDISTIHRLPVLGNSLTISHRQNSSSLKNEGRQSIRWRAAFNGTHRYVKVNGQKIKTTQQPEKMGNIISFIELDVPAGKKLVAQLMD
jgi:hypothetical protein